MDMETILEETVATEDLKKFEQKYHVELNNGKVHQPLFVLISIAHMCCKDQFVSQVSSVQCNIDYRSHQSLSLSMLGVW